MTSLQESKVRDYVSRTRSGENVLVDWTSAPWASAQPVLHWLGLGPNQTRPVRVPADAEAVAFLGAMMADRFWETGTLAYSSGFIASGLDALSSASAGPPEALVLAIWGRLGANLFTPEVAAFCQAIGREVLGRYRENRDWDLSWMAESASPSQACLRYWTLGVKPELWTDELSTEAEKLKQEFGFGF